MEKILALTLGSVAGGFARYYLAGLIYRILGAKFPFGTLAVNLVGCFLIGVFSILAEKKFLLGPSMRLFLMVGFCGAFTTFSTWVLETGNLINDRELMPAFLNIFLSIILGFVVFKLGTFLAEFI